MERTCGTLLLIKINIKTHDSKDVPCPTQSQVLFCSRYCHAALRANTGSGLIISKTQEVEVVARESSIARETIDPETVADVEVSIDEHQMNLCELDDCAEDN